MDQFLYSSTKINTSHFLQYCKKMATLFLQTPAASWQKISINLVLSSESKSTEKNRARFYATRVHDICQQRAAHDRKKRIEAVTLEKRHDGQFFKQPGELLIGVRPYLSPPKNNQKDQPVGSACSRQSIDTFVRPRLRV
ncbi:hypothetical protein [Oceanidesulfovibrio marinus]|uniref:hypothetical protein n=1 Tax=Oceanidesulfovibrio marinus TaxID=370038 RepID=UPI0011857716|nr:hypothetical protein [Oceanidesulfovibrio marinus]